MKLQTELLDDNEIAGFFKQDLNEMEKMINEYLSFAKGEIIGNYELTNIIDFFDEIIFEYKRSGYKNIRAFYDIQDKNVYIRKDLFKRCINNLINNSLRYRVSNIHINVKTRKTRLIVAVEDDGSGLSTDLLKKIKKSYYHHVNKDSKRNSTGLGLSIVEHIIDMHNGKIHFTKSRKLGGLCVILLIPIRNNNYATKDNK